MNKHMVISTCIYLQRNNQTLFLYRNKKENDFNKGYYIGVGGKLEFGESPEECAIREVKEETDYNIQSMRLVAYVTFVMDEEVEGMFLYTCDDFSGEMKKECNEGNLEWINNDEISTLNLLEGDLHFFEWFKQNRFVSAKLIYHKNNLVKIEEVYY